MGKKREALDKINGIQNEVNGEYDNSDLTDRQIADAALSSVLVVYAFSSLLDGLKPDAS